MQYLVSERLFTMILPFPRPSLSANPPTADHATTEDAVRVAKRALVRSSRDIPPRHANSPSSATTPTSSSKYQHDHEGRWQRGNASGDGNGDSSSSTSSTDANRHHHNYQGSSPHLHHRSRHRSGTGGGSGGRSRSTRSPTPSAMDQEENKKDSVDRRVTSGGGIDENSYGHQRRSGASPGGGGAADEEDVVAAGAALSALSSAPHPHTPLVSPLPSQRMASPKRVQENVYLTTVTSPPRGSGLGGGFSRPAPPADFSPRARAGGVRAGGDGDGGEGGGAGPGAVVTASAVYAFGQSPSKVCVGVALKGGTEGGWGEGSGLCQLVFATEVKWLFSVAFPTTPQVWIFPYPTLEISMKSERNDF